MRLTTGFVLWLVAAAAATAVGLAAVAAIGTDIFGAGQDPLSQSEVDELLTSQSRTSPAPPSSSAPPPPQDTTTATVGGTVISRCEAGLVRIMSASPAQNYGVDSDDDELDDHPSVKFFSGEREIEVRLRCVGDTPTATIRDDD
ncbi:MAG: hypothetical protein WBA97_04090 [Actinophytocola sp.]|uniref:hypothetical protein n=1 Tax=Actinophytocola sp. TaxID=1872138 RepID=UPI003C74ADC6